jgi:H+/Cl- antiporter ClcA
MAGGGHMEAQEHRELVLVAKGALVGVAAGFLVALYRWVVATAGEWLLTGVTWLHRFGVLGFIVVAAAVAVLTAIIGAIMRLKVACRGSGIPQVELEIQGEYELDAAGTVPARFASGALAALAGFSLGREGPSVELGAMCGKLFAQVAGESAAHKRTLMTCGAAAGMAAAFQAPLTGVMFALEEVHKRFTASVVITCMASCVCACYVANALFGLDPVLTLTYDQVIPQQWYVLLLVVGVVFGLASALHNQVMFWLKGVAARWGRGSLARVLVPLALVDVGLVWWLPVVCDGGDGLLEFLQARSFTPAVLSGLLLAKYGATALCFAGDLPGGTLYPLMCVGALTGGCVGSVACWACGLDTVYLVNFMLLGIAGLFAGVVRAPVTACLLVFELTGQIHALLPLALVSIVSYVVASWTGVDGLYEHLIVQLRAAQKAATGVASSSKDC